MGSKEASLASGGCLKWTLRELHILHIMYNNKSYCLVTSLKKKKATITTACQIFVISKSRCTSKRIKSRLLGAANQHVLNIKFQQIKKFHQNTDPS